MAGVAPSHGPPEEPPAPGPLALKLYPLAVRVPGLAYIPRPARRALRRAVLTRRVQRHTESLPDLRIVAVTGSTGKTTTKNLLGEMLAAAGPTLKTRGNRNDLDGVPATLLALRPHHRYAAVELGIYDEPGEMSWMASLFRPSVAILTGIGDDHVVDYGSREAIAQEKRALLERLPSDGTAIVNADDELARRTAEGLDCNVILAGVAEDADFRVLEARIAWPHGLDLVLVAGARRVELRVPLVGRHHALPVVLALAAAEAVGVPLEIAARAAASVEPAPGRMNVARGPRGSTFLLDDFKSRMPSAAVALATLAEVPAKRRIAVIGELQERDFTPAAYRELAQLLHDRADLIVAVGRGAPLLQSLLGDEKRVVSAPRIEDAAALIATEAAEGDVFLVHGASHQHLERIRLLLGREPVGCTVRRCILHWRCDECLYLGSGPPASCVELA